MDTSLPASPNESIEPDDSAGLVTMEPTEIPDPVLSIAHVSHDTSAQPSLIPTATAWRFSARRIRHRSVG